MTAANNTVNNFGTVNSTANEGIVVQDSHNAITNHSGGVIEGAGTGVIVDINLNSDGHNTLANDGAITGGFGGVAIYGIDNTVINNSSGVITGSADDAIHLYGGGGNSFTNYGTINSGPVSIEVRIDLNATGNAFINNGLIHAGNSGIDIFSNSNHITNNGTITVDNTLESILVAGNNNTITLGAHSNISGEINFTGTNNILQYTTGSTFPTEGGGFGGVGGGISSLPTLSGTLGVNYTLDEILGGAMPHGAVVVNSGGQTLAVTPDEFAGAESATINQSITDAGNLVAQHQQNFLLDENLVDSMQQKFASVDQLNNTASAAGGHPNKVFWTEGFGSYHERPADSDSAFSRARSGGVLAGLDHAESTDGYRSGFYVGGFGGTNDLGKSRFRTIDSTGALIGGYIGKTLKDDIYVSGQLSGGYSYNQSDRLVAGDTASANYNSYFLAPSVTVMRPFVSQGITFAPSATLRYAAQYAEGYDEKGSTANQDVDSRVTQTVGGRVQLEAHLPPKSGIKPILRVGVDGETNIGSNHVGLNVLSTNVSLDPDANNTIDGIIGLNLSYQTSNGPELYFDGEGQVGLNKADTGDNFGVTGRVGARWAF